MRDGGERRGPGIAVPSSMPGRSSDIQDILVLKKKKKNVIPCLTEIQI